MHIVGERMSFTEGKQPCDNFRPQLEANEYAVWENRHQCYECGGEVSFCLNCMKDHHDGGYDSCVDKRVKSQN